MDYGSAVKEARRLLAEVKKADRYYWDLAKLTWEQVKEGNVRQNQWAADIGVSQGTVALYLKAHDKYISHEIKPAWAQAYAEAKYPNAERDEGENYTTFESRQRAKSRVMSIPHEDKVEVARKLMADDDVAEDVLRDQRTHAKVARAAASVHTERNDEAKRSQNERAPGLTHASAVFNVLGQLTDARRRIVRTLGELRGIDLDEDERRTLSEVTGELENAVGWLSSYVNSGERSWDEALNRLLEA